MGYVIGVQNRAGLVELRANCSPNSEKSDVGSRLGAVAPSGKEAFTRARIASGSTLRESWGRHDQWTQERVGHKENTFVSFSPLPLVYAPFVVVLVLDLSACTCGADWVIRWSGADGKIATIGASYKEVCL